MRSVVCHIGIGSNLGDALENCKSAVEKISRTDFVSLIASSSFYKTDPVGDERQNYFINAVVEIMTTLSAEELLKALQKIEAGMGRKRTIKGGPRVIDLDILFYGQDIIKRNDLSVPHPEMHKRRFVLEPLNEIASYFIHPVYGVSVRGLKERLDDNKSVWLIERPVTQGRH
ncbi:MAG: 2-amino-4-hydroxy-6-hydroxymethyldihydropteridine diphosphokinase [Smithellaceae bacterium]|nr:2-amino-4-hydroxy-6-hydroxymethyldihydropteridine diphosphokinase [Smithellaceae bacterium]OPZ52940.1 MAG: Bifunctional folate synthesis protein [Deltaproteobacteria bacterium ADurb.BinA014]HNQ18753.1 2-amino-4-hydroxy-6-hydroxymethyldihydropteridine diphosphokinase [Smithellaceae bacterium]HNZ31377.1 2-amino-4-hydroxy-6-hydroxymethyldihydropteridine diphosphokinase [Smithellaceae bacterium]HOD31384.1 2-amino-4-hydroxy-6-hydroxymethyldihydropteridine diphosphokinase [Smithellaceae bacterium]